MPKHGKSIARRIRRAFAQVFAPGDLLGLAVVGECALYPAGMRVTVRLRGPQGMNGGAVLALGRQLRALLGLAPGIRLPVLVVRWVSHGASERPEKDDLDGAAQDVPFGGENSSRLTGAEGNGRTVYRPVYRTVCRDLANGGLAGFTSPNKINGPDRIIGSDRINGPDTWKRRRSLSPPSPWSALLSACG